MAKRRKRGRRRGLGSVITIRKLGMGSLDNPNSATGALLPVLIGGGVTAIVTLGLQSMDPTPDNQTVRENAAWIGAGAGGIAGLALWNLARPASGVMAIAGAFIALLATKLPAWLASARASAATQPGTAGLRAVVPEYQMRGLGRGNPMGAIVMQPTPASLRGAGETVNLSGVNVSVFGTPGFKR